MTTIVTDSAGNLVQAPKQGAVQTVSYSGTAGQSNAVLASTRLLRLTATSACFYLIGANPTATSSNGSYLPSGVVEFIGCNGTDKVSVVQSTTSGSLYITECA